MSDLTSRLYPSDYSASPAFASAADRNDPLAAIRARFLLPCDAAGRPKIYLCTNSLGLQPKTVREVIEHDLENWGKLGVDGHFHSDCPWYTYQDELRKPHADLVGAQPDEVILMNGLTVNLHLMLETFYRPQGDRTQILLDEPTFPSDLYAVQSHLKLRGRDPAQDLLGLGAPAGELLTTEQTERYLEQHGSRISLVLWSGINFLTGQAFDIGRVAAAARKQGCVFGLDLAHAVGNVPLKLNEWDVDFAVWCTYKYVCAGPGAIAGCYVNARHGQNVSLLRQAGWWGNDPAKRFHMQLQPEFQPKPGADGWQISNPPVLALAPLRAALPIFEEAGLPRLRAKSIALTGYLEYLLDQLPEQPLTVTTPRDPAARGCQLSLVFHKDSEQTLERLKGQGVICDFRKPNVIRVAPAPLYNTFTEVYEFVRMLEEALR
jgi:kynureninase